MEVELNGLWWYWYYGLLVVKVIEFESSVKMNVDLNTVTVVRSLCLEN